jgi:hypothetical protein
MTGTWPCWCLHGLAHQPIRLRVVHFSGALNPHCPRAKRSLWYRLAHTICCFYRTSSVPVNERSALSIEYARDVSAAAALFASVNYESTELLYLLSVQESMNVATCFVQKVPGQRKAMSLLTRIVGVLYSVQTRRGVTCRVRA